MFSRLLTSIFILSISKHYFCSQLCSNITDNDMTLTTLNGRILGQCLQSPVYYTPTYSTSADVMSWLSVPYAQPPINQNRFRPPLPVENYEFRNGTQKPPSCLQLNKNATSEDCLYLNIYVERHSYQNRGRTLKPILVFIHGGSYITGSSVEYEPSTIVSMSDIIVVTINYRLNALGFLYAAGSDAGGNMGLMDTAMALKWISENARFFGGDNTKITISGESAGAWSVGFMLFYPPSWRYFRNAILQSGGPTGIYNPYLLLSQEEASRRAGEFFWFLGCQSFSHYQSVQCALHKTSSEILEAYKQLDNFLINYEKKYESEIFLPVIDGYFFQKSISDLVSEGNFKNCNIITGYNQDEFALFFLYVYRFLGVDFTNALGTANKFGPLQFMNALKVVFKYFPTYPIQQTRIINDIFTEYFTIDEINHINSVNLIQKLSQLVSDFQYVCQSYQLASIYSNAGLNAFVYEFNYRLETSFIPSELAGTFLGNATHIDELYATFASLLTAELFKSGSQADRDFTQKIVYYWTNFVQFDNPNTNQSYMGVPVWNSFVSKTTILPTDTTYTGRYIEFNNDVISMKQGYSQHRCQFWRYF